MDDGTRKLIQDRMKAPSVRHSLRMDLVLYSEISPGELMCLVRRVMKERASVARVEVTHQLQITGEYHGFNVDENGEIIKE